MGLSVIISVLCMAVLAVFCQDTLSQPNKDQSDFFLEKLIQKFGTNGTLTISQIGNLIETLEKTNGHAGETQATGSHESKDNPKVDPVTYAETGSNLSEFLEQNCSTSNWTKDPSCWTKKCLSAGDIFSIHSIPPNNLINESQLHEISPAIIYTAQNKDCAHVGRHRSKPPTAKVWGYGILCVTLINLCSLGGLVFLPLMSKRFYKKLLMFMVALAVGTLVGSALLFLIPECFEMTDEDSPHFHTYIWKSSVVMGGIYLFFLIERLLKIIMVWRQDKMHEEALQKGPMCSIHSEAPKREEGMNMTFDLPANVQVEEDPAINREDSSVHLIKDQNGKHVKQNDIDSEYTVSKVNVSPVQNGAGDNGFMAMLEKKLEPPKDGKKTIKTVAWMVLIGDGLHNFIDGLSIGAAFAYNISSGISISIAVICEELPHELGDFAILLNSGMTMKQAMCCNFMSACMCYIGFIIGAVIGESPEHSLWIFAVAGGMFLYISLVDMLPEVNQAAEQEEKAIRQTWRVFFLQNAGLLTGFAIMIILAVFSDRINIS